MKATPRALILTALKWTGLFTGIIIIAAAGFCLLVLYGKFGKVYSREELKSIQSYLASEIYSSDNKLLGSFFWQNRSNTSIRNIPSHLIQALIATEDARFYEHRGVDFRSLLRVFFKTLLMRDKRAGGGSTISQQLAKNLFKREKHGILTLPVNKVKEAIHAVRLNKVYTQEEILLLYLNTVSLGEDTYGIKNASARFFGKGPESLTIEESAVLIGMLKSPTYYNPRLYPENALKRRNIVIRNMAASGYISLPVADSLAGLPLKLSYKNPGLYGEVAPYFLRQIEVLIRSILDTLRSPEGKKYNLYTDGLRINTTLDYSMQEYALVAIKTHMSALQKQFDRYWAKDQGLIARTLSRSPLYQRLKKEGKTKAQINKALNRQVPMEVFSWEGSRRVSFSYYDSVLYYLKLLHTGVLAMEPSSGHVKVWIGGNDYRFLQYDHIKAERQVGSTFKPVVYATALEQGMSPCDYIRNDRKVYAQFGGWSPENSDGKYGGKYSMKGALSNSVNTISVEVLLKAGIGNSVRTARKMGIKGPLPAVPALALGVASISLFEMVKAYCVFPNGGMPVRPVLITSIHDKNGNVIYSNGKLSPPQRAIEVQTASYMNEMLGSVINEGTASRIRTKYGIRGDLAGKTGTTQSAADGWFIGYSRGLVTGVWVGADDPSVHFRATELAQGAYMALPIWAIFMKKLQNDPAKAAYLKGSLVFSNVKRAGQCSSFMEDTFLDKVKDFFRKKTPEERKLRREMRKQRRMQKKQAQEARMRNL